MIAINTWPDAAFYMMLTALSRATTQEITQDDETDSYVPPQTVNPPFNVPQLSTTLHATGPLITKFPIPIQALMDIDC